MTNPENKTRDTRHEMPDTNKVAVFGDADFVMPFAALGLDTYAVGQKPGDVAENAQKIVDGKYALVVVAENVAKRVQEAFSAQMNAPTPCIVVVPFTTESDGFATRALSQVLKMATGVNILQNADASKK